MAAYFFIPEVIANHYNWNLIPGVYDYNEVRKIVHSTTRLLFQSDRIINNNRVIKHRRHPTFRKEVRITDFEIDALIDNSENYIIIYKESAVQD